MVLTISNLQEVTEKFPDMNPKLIKFALEERIYLTPDDDKIDLSDYLDGDDGINIDKLISILLNIKNDGYDSVVLDDYETIRAYKGITDEQIKAAILRKKENLKRTLSNCIKNIENNNVANDKLLEKINQINELLASE